MTSPTRLARPLAGLLAADIISTTGTEMTAVALPWFVLVTTHSPARMGAVLAAEFVGMTLLGLWGGRAATVLGSRRMMLASDLSRAALIGLIPILYRLGALSFAVLLLVGVAIGSFFPGYSSAQRLVLAGLVDDDEVRLTRVGGLTNSVNETASFVGPAFGGALVALIGPTNVLVVDALSYLAAFALVATLVPDTGATPDAEGGVLEGLRYVWRNAVLRQQVIGIGLVEIGWTAMMATLPVLALHHGGPSMAGWLIASYGAGSVIGGLVSTRARGTGRAAWTVAGIAGSTWLLLLPVPVPWLTVAVGANGVFSGLFFPRFFAAVTTGTPPGLRARVMTSVNIAISAPGPVGYLGAGLLNQHSASAVPSLLLVVATGTIGALVIAAGHG